LGVLFRLLGFLGLLAPLACTPALADAEADKAAIAGRLEAWADAFNARDVARTCDLFSADLASTMRGRADEGRDAVCRRIASALADRGVTMRYAPDIHEILVSGDLAVVRLVWSVTVQRGPKPAVSKEPGLDVFRREPDGQWRIIRFLAFSNAPD
jgi:steroid delta-isomerase